MGYEGRTEDRIVFQEPDGQIRALSGKIIKETETDITIERDDGEWTVSKKFMVKMFKCKTGNGGVGNGGK